MDKKRTVAKSKPKRQLSKTIKKLTFNVPQFITSEKTALWFLGVFVLFVLIIIFALWEKDYRLGVIFLLGVIVFYQMALSNPRKVTLEFNPKGIIFGDKKYSWNVFRSFSIWEEKNHFIVHLEKRSSIAGPLVLAIPNSKDRSLVPIALGSVLAEKYHPHTTTSDLFARLVRY